MVDSDCIVINLRSAVTLVLLFFVNGIHQSQTALNSMEPSSKVEYQKNITSDAEPISIPQNQTSSCPSEIECKNLNVTCLNCNYKKNCRYGKDVNITCEVKSSYACVGEKTFNRTMNCRYCYQTEIWQHRCELKGHCNSMDPKARYKTNCTVYDNVLCLGNREFSKRVPCNWTHGYKWSTALIISLTLGGFGADRFYLGHWQEGIGKLFSFGGLGVWTIIDVLLISLHYLGPADGSLFI
ncbi:TM2 domain-containing protein almondex [Condylostylus longicornis]|uniref:TM2 domain-containing protein almondex n=1 Tax=Condylostylus longicornis TaxID=2530218 RepID=UPI00244DB110|nr:TM2 domain-containing protein almondex [Condylostylus longicornis]